MQTTYRLILLLIVSLSGIGASHAQNPNVTLRGIVRDSTTHLALEDASVTIYLTDLGKSATLLGSHRSTNRGFVFRGLSPGNYRLLATYLGYLADTVDLTLTPADSAGPIITMAMRRNGKNLMQVVVTARIPPAIVRNDTIAFNAGAYPTRPNATVEDLLRKLPGIEIDKNGNVTMQGQKVDKIYLDGKEFFLNDPRLATQNLPADIVDQIEAFDSQTEKARLTGIRDATGAKSINIKLKKNRRHGYFGKAYAGTGTGAPNDPSSPVGAYSAGGTATSLGKSWLFGTGNVNNINNQFTGEENRNGPGGGGTQVQNNLEFNYSNNKGDKATPSQRRRNNPEGDASPLAVTLNAGTGGSRTTLNQTSSTLTALNDSSLLENRNSRSTNSNQSTHGNLYLEYRPDSSNLIDLRSTVTSTTGHSNETDSTAVSTQKTQNTYPDNQGITVNNSRSTSLNLNNQLNYRWLGHRRGRTLFVSLSQNHTQFNQPQTTYSLIQNFDSAATSLPPTLIHQSITQTSGSDGYSGSLAYTEPLRPGHVLDLSYRLNETTSRSDRRSDDYDSATGRFDLPDSANSNHFTAVNTIQRLGAGYNATDGKFQYQLGLAVQFATLGNRNRTTDSTLTLRQTNWYPRASLVYSPGHGRSLRLQYSASTTSPTIQQLQPVADPTNPFLVRIGNPGLLQQLTHSVNINYTSLNIHSFQNWQLSLRGTYDEHALSTATTILAGGIQQIQTINVNGAWNSGANLSYGFPLGDQRKGSSSLSLHGSYGRNVSLSNGLADVTATLGWGAGWNLNLHPTDRLFLEAQAGLSYTGNHYSLNPAQNTASWQQNYSLDASYALPGAVTLSTLYTLQVTGAQGSLPAQSVPLWNAAVAKDLGRRRNSQLRLSAFGLLNTTHNITQTIGTNYVSTAQSNLPGRILLLSFVYHFRHFPGAGK